MRVRTHGIVFQEAGKGFQPGIMLRENGDLLADALLAVPEETLY